MSVDSSQTLKYLLSTAAVRERSLMVYDHILQGKSSRFQIDLAKMPVVCDFVMKEIKQNYPKLDIPYHSRWQHFLVGGVDRVAKIKSDEGRERGRVLFDLVIPSILLDAGAGMAWKYKDDSGTFSKSEGLAVASFNMFCAGMFSNDPRNPYQATADALEFLQPKDLERGMQVSESNPLVGVAGRCHVLNRLGKLVKKNKDVFGSSGRLGNFFDYILDRHARNETLHAHDILVSVLEILGPMWPGRKEINGVNLGDTWEYTPLSFGDKAQHLLPFHKLSQWMTYSLVEPFEWIGVKVNGLEQMTGLPEYRNGGLFVDFGVINPQGKDAFTKEHEVSDLFVMEWRALTVSLLDELAKMIWNQMNVTALQFPLAKILQGGTWSAGRKIAKEKRADGGPPFKIKSDGTVF